MDLTHVDGSSRESLNFMSGMPMHADSRNLPGQLHWTAGLHHDGSALYVSNPLPRSGETVRIRLRAPRSAPVQMVFLRTMPDGEQHLERMNITSHDSLSNWWEATLRLTMPVVSYSFKIVSEEGIFYLSGTGASRADSPETNHFRLLADYAAPGWIDNSVFYQIFPDRFCNGDPTNDIPNGSWSRFSFGLQRTFRTQQRPWGAPVLTYAEAGSLDFYGGDLPGIAQKIDYLRDLGVNALYLTPIFTSPSNHRYNISDFEHVDPYLGGDEALAELRRALDQADMRLILDVTPNHTGDQHPWFTAAQADIHALTADYYTFYRYPNVYESWLGHRSLPKLNYRSHALREAMYRAPDSVLRRWLASPYAIDGWRLDVYNMMAKQGTTQLTQKIGRGMRQAVKGDNPDAYLVGEHFFDGTPHLQGDELDAIMNYQGFTYPVRKWLAEDFEKTPTGVLLPAEVVAEQMTRFRAALPWVIARQQYNLLDSHDIPRTLTSLEGNSALFRMATVLLMTYPGVPSIYYGGEIGLQDDQRQCMIWDESLWNHDLRAVYQQLIHLRRTASALIDGGFQQLYAAGDVIAYQRQSADQRLIVIAYRGPDDLPEITIPIWHAGIADDTVLVDLLGERNFTVKNGALYLDHLEPGTAFVLEAEK